MGTYGSRSLAVGGSAMVKAMDKIVTKGKKIAAHLMEAAVADIVFKDGKFSVAGTDKVEDTRARSRWPPMCRTTTRSRRWSPGWTRTPSTIRRTSSSPVAAISARSRSTPRPVSAEVIQFVAVDDIGRVVNPMIVEGQVHGGVAQGIGQALLESAVYEPAGSS